MSTELQYDCSQHSKELAERIFLDHLNDSAYFPKYIQIGTVNFCNARCTMCPYSAEKAVKRQTVEEQLFDKIIAELETYSEWIESIALYWLGEPTLDIRMKDRIEKLKRIGIKNIQISTNGFGLNKEMAADLFEAGLNDLRFSIDALEKETYERIRRGLDYEQVMQNVQDILHLRDSQYPKIPIRIRLTEMEENMAEIDSFKKYWGG